MDSVEPKKTLIIRIYQILEEYSDERHPLKQQDIIDYLEKDYGISCERKAIARNIAALQQANFEIYDIPRKGYYLDERAFEYAELKLLVDYVLCSGYIPAEHSKRLIKKLTKLGGAEFKVYVKNAYAVNDWGKTENNSMLNNIECISEAIKRNRKVTFTYNKYQIDKKLHKTSTLTVSPYMLIPHNQRYYLMAKPNRWKDVGFYRIDKMTELTICMQPADDIRTIEEYKNGINYRRIAAAHPYMFGGKPVRIELECEEYIVDDLFDWFGSDIIVNEREGKVKTIIYASEKAMLYWVMQYSPSVKVVAPESLREQLITNLSKSLKMY